MENNSVWHTNGPGVSRASSPALPSAVEVKAQINQQLVNEFPTCSHDYRNVAALVFHWKDSDDDGYLQEAIQVAEMFDTDFGYNVTRVAIPDHGPKSHYFVESRVSEFLLLHDSPSTLLIIFYGGHGDRDIRRRRSVWRGRPHSGSVEWYKIQPRLQESASDVLIILDCCFAAQSGREGVIEPSSRVELLAASAMDVPTPAPGPFSFTVALMKELRCMLSESGSAIIAHLHGRLVNRNAKLQQTPVYVDLNQQSYRRSIRLQKIGIAIPRADNSEEVEDLSSLMFKVSVRRPLNKFLLSGLIQWLKTEAPPEISRVEVSEVVMKSEKMHNFLFEERDISEKNDPLFDGLSTEGQADVLETWTNVKSLLVTGKTSVTQTTPETAYANEDFARKFLQELKTRNELLFQTIQRNILAIPALGDSAKLDKLATSEGAQALGITEPLRMRQLVLDPSFERDIQEIAPLTSLSSVGHEKFPCNMFYGKLGSGDPVFVEYKRLDNTGNPDIDIKKQPSFQRMYQLAKLLNLPKPSSFRTLRCVSWFYTSTEGESRIGLVFEVPSGYQGPPFTLRQVLDMQEKTLRPSLGQRFEIGYNVARALEEWHSVNWVHQGICSNTILFFRQSKAQNWDFSAPYLGGFEHSRPNLARSSPLNILNPETYFESRIYCHPGRRMGERFVKEHDLFAFGIALLEIGLWQSVDKMFPTRKSDRQRVIDDPFLAQKHFQQMAGERLAHFMGGPFRDAVCCCLCETYGVDLDDKVQSRLGKAFHDKVVQLLTLGLPLR